MQSRAIVIARDHLSVFKGFGVGLIGPVPDLDWNAGATIASKLASPQNRGTRTKWEQTM